MIEIYKKVVLHNYASFNGRIRRKEYLAFILVHIILVIILNKIDNVAKLTFGEVEMGALELTYNLFVLIPLIGATVRRMHDVGKSGLYVLIPFYNVILLCTGGEEGTNRYGEDPIDEMDYLRELGKDLN
ncbi:DUF805 domain-containing protein [Flavobacterium sp. SH_e]|uniref:DUF805 domain-containing protein n=1 Tax=Flavobacterium TaxID=237 RepID=UPI0021E3C1BF|nr:DUF805 domain-containing protein [Flavobacterium sp. SH_e]MCV2485472.1 DUF805 domain-containing protein [Flavobacterium sp. SH_e]